MRTPSRAAARAVSPERSAQLVLQHLEHRAVKFLGLRHAHAVHLAGDDVEAGAAKRDRSRRRGARSGKRKLSGLMSTSVFSTFVPVGKLDRLVEQAAVRVGIRRPEQQIAFARCPRPAARARRARSRSRSPFASDDVVAIGVADRLAAGPLVDDVARRSCGASHRVLALENQQQHPRLRAGSVGGKVLQDVLLDQLLRRAMPRVRDRSRSPAAYFSTSSALGANIRAATRSEPRPRDQPRQDAAGPRLANRVGSDEHVGKFFGHR